MNRKHVLAVLTCLIMLSSLTGGLLPKLARAQVWTGPTIKMWAITMADPLGVAYLDLWVALAPELEKIGIKINLVKLDLFDIYCAFYDNWEVYGDIDGDGIWDGWDLTILEWWLNPTSYIWLDEMVLSEKVPEWNVMPWMDERADRFYKEAMATLDPAVHNQLMGWWQEEFMHNPPVIVLYYAEVMTSRASYLDGWDDTAWFYDLRSLRINKTRFEEVAPSSRKAVGNDTVIYGASETVSGWHPFYTIYFNEELMNVVRMGMLYGNTRQDMEFPTSGGFEVYPYLAADLPTWYEASALYPADYPEDLYPDYMVARIPLRQSIYWSDGMEFNATDVAFTYNAMLDRRAGSYARNEYIHIINEVRVVDEHTVDFILYAPRYDFAGYLAHGWEIAMLPYHQFVKWGIADKPGLWDVHESNFDPIPESLGGQGLEVLGPYVPVASDAPTDPTWVELQRFDLATGQPWYWADLGWGTELPENLLVKIIPDYWDRFFALRTLEVDFIENVIDPLYPTTIYDWLSMADWPTHRVYAFPYSASLPLWMNLNNPVLSNRYVRQAIAHAIPYQKIFDEILPYWGVSTAIPGKTFILPWHESFHTELLPYEYDIAKAQKYMWMFWNSLGETAWSKLTDAPYTAVAENGPVGDHNLDGFVDLADFHVWVQRLRTHPSEYEQYKYPYPYAYPTHNRTLYPNSYWPGNDVDPDNDNNNYVELADFTLWREKLGTRYPFEGAR